MSTPKDWRPVITGEDWMRDREKRSAHEERRPQISSAADLLGPGFGAYAVPITDWNDEGTLFNGFWDADDALNAPNAGSHYLGLSISTVEGHTSQVAFSHSGSSIFFRQVHAHDIGPRTYGTWLRVAPVTSAMSPGSMMGWPAAAATPGGWLAANGLTVNRATYPDLANVLGVAATATTFVLPNVPNSGDMKYIVKV